MERRVNAQVSKKSIVVILNLSIKGNKTFTITRKIICDSMYKGLEGKRSSKPGQ